MSTRWEYADVLRLHAYSSDGLVDRDVLAAAREELLAGLRLRAPRPDEAWVLVTQAKIDEDLGGEVDDPALTLERAILLEPENDLVHAFLASTLRRQGFAGEAAEASVHGTAAVISADPFVFNTRLSLCLDAGDHDATLAMLDDWALVGADDSSAAAERAQVLLRMGRRTEARDLLASAGDADMVRLYRALAAHADGAREVARAEFSALWLDTRSGPTYEMAGWAAFGAGLVDEAIDLYTPLAEKAPDHLPYRRDLGQMLLVRGDVEDGVRLLEEGIDLCPFADQLLHLRSIEFGFIRGEVATLPHAPAVDAVLLALEGRIDARVTLLRERRRNPDEPSARAAAARLATHEGDHLVALDAYRGLVASGVVPEAGRGLLRAAEAARDTADAAHVAGELERARVQWSAVEITLGDVEDGADLLTRSLRCRLLLSELFAMPLSDAATWLESVDDPSDLAWPTALSEAADVLASTPDRLWALRDGLRRVAGDPAASSTARDLLGGLADGLPLARTYGLLAPRDTAGGSTTFSSVAPLELQLGPLVSRSLDLEEIDRGVERVRRSIEETKGVRIPWVHSMTQPDLPPRRVDYRVYGRWVASSDLDGDPDGWLDTILGGLASTVRGHLYRLVGIDDVMLWLEGWDLDEPDAPEWRPSDPGAERLRLTRLLRMLVREGGSVADRAAIVAGLDAQLDRRRPTAALATVRDVRLRLRPDALGVEPTSRVVDLEPDLERRMIDGLADGEPVWEVDRSEAHRTVTDLRAWLAAQPEPPDVVVVEHAGVRPFVWRLLAAERPAVCVLTEEEMR